MDQASASYRQPDYRGSFRDGTLTLVAHAPWMQRAFGFAGQVLRETSDVVLADFEVFRGSEGLELIVSELNTPTDEFQSAVVEFAQGLGYRRLWIGGELIELTQEVGLGPVEAATTCSTCGTTYRESHLDFILRARSMGAWPLACPLCGGPLPVWSLGRQEPVEAVSQARSGSGGLHVGR